MRNFLDIDEQIEQNTKILEFYYSNYQKTQSKISILIIIYSLLAIYILQLVKYPILHFTDTSRIMIGIYILLLFCFFLFLGWSIKYTYLLLKPMEVAYIHYPSFFYTDIRKQYETKLNTNNEDKLNEYVKSTYLNELELAVTSNSELFEIKNKYYNTAFNKSIIALVIYLICTGFVVFEPEKPKDINLKNYPEILNTIDSINLNYKMMSEDKKSKSTSDSSKVKVNPKEVIKTEPRMIRENFSSQEKIKNKKKGHRN